MPKSNNQCVLLLSCLSIFHRKIRCDHKSREHSNPDSWIEREELQRGGPLLMYAHRLPGDEMCKTRL